MSRRTGVAVGLAAAVVVAVALGAAIARPGAAPAVASPTPPLAPQSASPSPPPVAATVTPSATAVHATPAASAPVPAVSLLDIRANGVVQLVETSGYVLHADFVRGRPEVLVGMGSANPPGLNTLHRFDLAGRQLERAEWPQRGIAGDLARCNEIRSVYASGPAGPQPIVEIDGKRLENVTCGAISPDDRWMTYWLWAEGARPDSRPLHIEQWLIDLQSGQRRLLKRELVHCGGCDSVPSPKWSPSSRYVWFSDVVAGGDRFFLADVRTGEVRALADHVPREPFDVPEWSPVADVLIRSSAGRILVERLPGGSPTMFGEWPARFDATGRYVYSPAWPAEGGSPPRTRLFDSTTGALVTELPGLPDKRTFIGIGGPPIDPQPVVRSAGGWVAALQGAPGCDGTTIHAVTRTCVARAGAAQVSRDGSLVALLRPTGDAITTERCRSCFLAEVVVIDAASGREIAAVSRSIRLPVSSQMRREARLVWNAEGTHLLVSPTS